MKVLLWVDDLRNPDDYPFITDGMSRVIWVDNYVDAVIALQEKDFSHVSLDNDLGTEKEGKDVLNVIDRMLYNHQLPNLQVVNIHSHNSSAVDNMYSARDYFRGNYLVTITKVRA